jgi:hypothetical protein
MGVAVNFLVKRTFDKVFKNLAIELNESVNDIQLGIYFEGDAHKYECFKNGVHIKNIDDLDVYIDNIFNAGSGVMDQTISACGPRYARELNEKKRKEWIEEGNLLGKEYEVKPDNIKIIMKYKEGSLPTTILMCDGKPQRAIDVEKEFLT